MEKTTITFEESDGRKVTCEVTVDNDIPETTININFDPKVKKDEKGLYLALLDIFIEALNK